ncbi:hypothetical protein CMEL01_14043 [Colletotrichum melonis]|uniref:C2H2-type domain-containing protein n=1 Tax=Colletotrichum melonis TaxID=1209925 RepID=A0AAI9UU28_9PEZI|nr:hypothetical protein CMEL01_14043 [Colletotrichum melonis]
MQSSNIYQLNTENKNAKENPTMSPTKPTGQAPKTANSHCDVQGCNEKFARQDNLIRHMRNRHLEATLEQTSSLHSPKPLSRHDLDCLETADTKGIHQDLFDDSWLSLPESDLAQYQTLQLSDPESHDAEYLYRWSDRDSANSASRDPYWAIPKLLMAPSSHRTITELVSEALQELEIRLELTQYQKTTDQGGGKAPERRRGREPGESQQRRSTKRRAGAGNRRDDTDGNKSDCRSDDDFDDSGPEEKKDRSDGDDTEPDYLACPLHRKDPRRYSAFAKCRLRRSRDVKQHMRRRHRRPEFYCPTCWETYSGPDERDQHVIERSCDSPQEQGQPWITQEQHIQLEGRVPNGSTVEQWYTVWDIVCPGQIRPKPPFCFLGEMVENIGTLRQEIWEEEGPEIAEQLIAQREATLRERLTGENRNLLKRCIMDAVRYVLKHPDVTKAGKVRWNQDGGQSEAALEYQGSGCVHGVLVDDPNALHHTDSGLQYDLPQDGHTSIRSQGLQFSETQLGELDLTSWWTSEAWVQGFDEDNLNFLDAFTLAFGEGHGAAFDLAGGRTSA